MKKLPIVLLLSLVVSCSKEEEGGDDGSCHRVVQVFDAVAGQGPSATPFATFTYDDSARVVNVTGPGEDRRVYRYYKDSIAVKTTYGNGEVLQDTYFLDGRGRVVRSRFADQDFRYDSEGYLVSFQRHNGKYDQGSAYVRYFLRYEDGNVAEVYSSDPAASLPSIILHYYDRPHQDLLGLNSPLWEGRVLGDWGMLYLVPGGYFGKASRSLLKSAYYQFDEWGRITTMVDRYAFKYQCP